MKKITKEQQEKMKEAKMGKRLLTFLEWEIWVDSLQYITICKKIERYHVTLSGAILYIIEQRRRSGLKEEKGLEMLVSQIKRIDQDTLDRLSACLVSLGTMRK